MCKTFSQKNASLAIWDEYYKAFNVPKKERIDFSSPKTLRLFDAEGNCYTPEHYGDFMHFVFLITEKCPAIRRWVNNDFLMGAEEELRRREYPKQIMRDLCKAEAQDMLARVMPTSKGHSAVRHLLPPEVQSDPTPILLRDMKSVQNFDTFMSFLLKHAQVKLD